MNKIMICLTMFLIPTIAFADEKINNRVAESLCKHVQGDSHTKCLSDVLDWLRKIN